MGVLDILQKVFAPNQEKIQNAVKNTDLSGVANSGTAADYIPKVVQTNSSGKSSGKGTSGSGSSGNSQMANFWSSLRAAGQEAGNPNKYNQTSSGSSSKSSSGKKTTQPIITVPTGMDSPTLITVGNNLRPYAEAAGNRIRSDIQEVKDANTTKVSSTVKDPTKIVTVEMPTSGNEKKDKILEDYKAEVTNENSQAWIEKYRGSDLDSALTDLKKQIDKAPHGTSEELLERAKLIAEYQFLEASRNYGVYMNYDMKGGRAQVDKMDEQIAALKDKISKYEDVKYKNDAMAWNVENDPQYAAVKKMSDKDYEQAKADLAALEQYRKNLYNEIRDARNVRTEAVAMDLRADAEFENYAKKGAMMEGNERAEQSGGSKSLYSYMTEDEQKTYDAFFALGGKKSADQYFDYLEDTLKMRAGQAKAKDIDNTKSDAWQTVRAQGYAGWNQLGKAFRDLGSGITGKEQESSVGDYAMGYIREDLGKMDSGLNAMNLPNGNNFSQLLFDATGSFAHMAPSLALAYAVGQIPGMQGQAAQLVGSAFMFGSVYGGVRDEMVKAGYNEKSASTYAALNAASEVALEKVLGGFEALGGAAGLPVLEKSLGNISNAYFRYAATMGVKVMGEGTEEYLQDVIDPLFRNMAFSENNEFNIISEEGAYSYLVAAISVLGSESIHTGITVARSEAAGAYVNAVREANPELYEQLLNTALESKNNDVRELAEGLKSGEYKQTNGNVGQLIIEMAQARGKDKVSAEKLIKESADKLYQLKIGSVQTDARAKAQEDWERIVAENPDKVVLNPIQSALAERTGWDTETVKEQGEILSKIVSGIIPTSREIDALDLNNRYVQEIFQEYTGIDLSDVVTKDGVKSRMDVAQKIKTAAKNAADTETYQQELKKANEAFIEGRSNYLMANDFAPKVQEAIDQSKAGLDIKMGKARFSKKKSAPTVIKPADKTNGDGLAGLDKKSFVKAYMEKHGVSKADAIKAWETRVATNAALNGGNENGEQVRSDDAGRVDDVAERDGVSEVREGAAGSDATVGESTAEDRSGEGAATGVPVNGKVIPETEYSDEQRDFVKGCTNDGFKSVTLIDGPLYSANGTKLNAKVDKQGNLTISATDPTTMQKVARHERVHLWLNVFGERTAERAAFVKNALTRIIPEQRLVKLYDAYAEKYGDVYADLSDQEFFDAIYEEILCDMAGGMFNYGVDAGSYYNAATKLITDSRIRENFLENGPRMAESQNQASTVNTENVGETTETPTENVEPAIDIDKAVAETLGVDEDEPTLDELLAEAEEEEGSYRQKDGYWMDDEYYSVAPDTPKQAPNFLSPFKADVNQTIPPDARPFPGENAMHEGLEKFSISGMVQGANFELKLNSAGYPYQVLDKATGKPIKHVEPYMMKDTPLGNLIEMAMTDGSLKDLSDDQKIAAAEAQYKMLADAMNLIVEYNDAALVWELVGSQMFSAIKSNSDKQYNRTIDFSTICKKTQAIVNAMSETMKQLNRGLTRREVEAVYLETGKAGESTPCPVCYVFSRWMGIGNLLDQINRFQTKFTDMDEAEIVTFMEQVEKDAHDYAEEQIKKAKDPEKKRNSFYDKNGEFKMGKVLSSMKPNSDESSAIKALSAHRQATARIAELEAAMATASPEEQAKYKNWIKSLKKLTLSEKKLAATQKKLETADAKIERLEAYQWLASTLMYKTQKIENGVPVFDENGEAVNVWAKNPKFKPVPPDILFDLNKGADFAEKYPLTWAFRTGKGCAMGKAITPYADARVGETIQGVAGGIKDIRVSEMAVDDEGVLRPVADKDVNEFLNGDTKKQRATLASAIKNMRRQNLIGGMRYQSTSDFRYEYGSDYLMTFFEMQAMGANVQLYTKVIEAVDFLASTGADCNLSLMPLADGYRINPETGKKELVFSDVTGINHKAAIAKAKQYDNVQCILVGINDENIRLALESEDVTFVIPFHGSGQSVHQIQTLMDMLGEHLDVMQAEDYTAVQSDREIPDRAEKHPELQAMWDLRMDIIMGKLQDGITEEQSRLLDQNPHLQKLYDMFYVNENDPAYQNFLAKDQAQQIFPYEYWDKTTTYETADRNGEIFKSYCESMGVVPRFSGKNAKNQDAGFGNFAYGGENGQCVKGYWKLLIDRKMYENTYDEAGNWTGYGKYREQQQINMSNVKLENLDPKWGKANFTEKEMSKPIDTSKTKDIAAESIKAIEILRATGDIFDRTAVTKKAREILTNTQLNRQPTSAELLKQESAKLSERASVASDENVTETQPAVDEDVEQEPVISPEVSAQEIEETDTRYSIRSEDPPKKTMIGYKVFRVDKNHPGQLYPTKVANPEGQGTPVGVWLNADTGEIARDKEGNIKTNKSGRISVKAGSETLAWRPGWHLGELPEANQMNQYDPNNPDADRVSEGVMHDDYVFCECEFAADEDYQLEAFQMGFNAKGGYLHSQAGLPFIPKDGYYKYRTNPDPNTAPWFISGAIKITKILDDNMRREIIEKWNAEHPDDPPMRVAPRYSGKDIDLTEYGFEAGPVKPTENLNEVAPGVDYSNEIKDLPGYKPNHINWENKNFQNAFKINGIENRKEELRQKYEGNRERYSVSDEDVSDKIKEAETGGKHPVNQPTNTVSQTESDVNTEQYSVFSDQVDEVKNNTYNPQQAVNMGQTPKTITDILWLPKLPMLVTPNHVYSMAVSERQARAERRFKRGFHYHDLGWDVVKQIPRDMGKPVLIIKSTTDPTDADVVVVLDREDSAGRPVFAVIRPNGTGKYIGLSLSDTAFLTGYGRNNIQNYIARAKTENRILYANKNNHRRGSRGVQSSNASAHNSPGVRYSDAIMSGDYSNNLAQYRQIVKDKVKGTIFENSVGLNYSVSDESNQSKKTESPFPKGSLEDNLYGLVTAKTIDEAEAWLNKQREKSELGKDARKAKPVIPKADDVIPVGKVEREVHQNEIEELIDKYGQMPAGEKAAREARVPNKTGPDSHVRRFVRNVEEAPNTSQRTIEQIEREIITGSDVANYARITDTKAVNAADNYYKTYGYNGLKNEWDRVSGVENKVPTKYDVAKGERLLIEADRQGDAATVLKVVADLAALGTEAGQVVQAMRLLKKMGPVGQLYYFQKAVDRLNKRFETRIMKGKLEPIHIDKALAQKVLLANTEEEIEAAMKELVKETAKQLPVTLVDQWNAWRYLAMLGNPRTHIRNWLGNDFFRPLRFAKDLLAAAGETIFLRDRSQRTKSGKYLLSGGRFSPAYTALNAAAASDFEVMKAQITGTGKMNPMNELLQAREIFRGPLKFLNKISDFNSELLEKEDLFFLKRAYINAMAEYMAARGLTAEDINKDSKELNQARQYAVQEAQKATYRDFCWAANALNQLKGTTGGAILIDGLVPFTKTPINIGKRGVEYSPIGLLKGLTVDLIKVQKGDLTAAEAIDHIAAGMSGTMIAVLGVLLAKLGIARGADDDDKKKAELERAQGHQEYSLEIGGRSFTVDWVAPVSLPFFVGVEAYKHITEGGPMDFYDYADVLTLILEPMTSLSMLDGINQTLSAASYADNNAVQAVLTSIGTSYLSQGLPTLGAQLARTIDPYRRSNYTDKGDKAPGWMQTFVQQNMGKIPGVSQEKMAYVDTWGRKQTSGGVGMRALENFIFPFYMKTVNENPVERELMRLSKATGDNEVLPSSISKSFTVDGETLNLNAEQYEKLKTVTGRESLKLLGEIMMSPAYTELDDAEKAKMIKNAMTITSTLGRQAIREDYKPAAWVQRAIDNDNYEAAVTFHVMQSMETGLSNYQLIECMYWLTPEDQGKLITAQYTPQAKMTDYKQKKHKFILDDDMKARSREIYEEMFWQAYPELTASQKWADADIAGRAELVKKLQTDVGKAARSAYGDELRAQGVASVYLDSPEEEAEEIAAVLNEFGYEP